MLIDPSYEIKSDYGKVSACIQELIRRFPTGTYLVWYPADAMGMLLVAPLTMAMLSRDANAGHIPFDWRQALVPWLFLASVAALQTVRRGVPRWRPVIAAGTAAFGALILGLACRMGENGSTAGFFAAFLGAALVSVGFLISAPVIVPRLVSVCGRAVGASPSAVLARKNAVSDPTRTTRSAVGLLIGVTLVTSIAAGMTSLHKAVRNNWTDLTPEEIATNDKILSITTTVLVAIIAISVIIAAVGFISTMSLTVISRTREIGMLRAMGFTARQVRSMIFRESLALTGTAVVCGLLAGIVFGSIASQSLIGHLSSGMPIGLPWGVLVAIISGTFALAVVASLPPSRRAVAVSPVDALAVA